MNRRSFVYGVLPVMAIAPKDKRITLKAFPNIYCPECGHMMVIYPQNRKAIGKKDAYVIAVCKNDAAPACPNLNLEYAVYFQKVEGIPLTVANPDVKGKL